MNENSEHLDESEKIECAQLFDAVWCMIGPHPDSIRQSVVANICAYVITSATGSEQEAMEFAAKFAALIAEAVLMQFQDEATAETVDELLKRGRRQ